MIGNGLPDPDSDADRHQNVISWSLGHTPALHKISSKSVGNFFDNLVNPDFGLSDSWVRTVIQIVTKIYLLGPWGMPYPSNKFRQNPFTTFSVIRRTDRQTDKQTDRRENITSFFGGSNNTVTTTRGRVRVGPNF